MLEEHLRGDHVCWATGKDRRQFHWSFTGDLFEIHPDEKAPIPQDVLDTILGKGAQADRIKGRWRLNGGSLQLTHMAAEPGGRKHPDVTLSPFRTPVVRIHFGPTQYVLGPK